MSTLRIVNDRTAFFGLAIGGVALCSVGIGKAAARGWVEPISIGGYALGLVILALTGMTLTRRWAGPIRNDRDALLALIGLIVVKTLLGTLYSL